MGYYITPNNEYYEGDRAHSLDNEVPQRPHYTYDWNGTEWVQNDEKTKEVNNGPIINEIRELESKQDRHLREIALGKGDIISNGFTPKQRLEMLDNQISALRLQLK